MNTRQIVSDEQQKQLKLNQQRLDEYTQKYKGPVLSLCAQTTQTIPNVIDQLIHIAIKLHQQIDEMTKEKIKVDGELATLKSVSKPDKKEAVDPYPIPKDTVVPSNDRPQAGSIPVEKPTTKQT